MSMKNGMDKAPTYSVGTERPKLLFFDLETDGLDPTCIHCLVTMDEDGDIHRYNHAKEGNLRDGLTALRTADLLIGHNIVSYDLQVIQTLYPSWHTSAALRDTLVCSRLAWPHRRDLDFKLKDYPRDLIGSHSLKAWGVRLGYEKYAYGEKEDAWKQWSEEMEDYCVRDVEITRRLWALFLEEGIPEDALELEHEIHDICEVMTWRGFYFDREGAEKLYARLLAEKDQLAMKLQEIFPPQKIQMKTKVKEVPFNPGSRVQIAERFREQGWTPTEFTPDGRAKINDVILSELSDAYPEAGPLNRYLLIQKRIGQLADGKHSWLGACDEENRIHGKAITCGGTVSHRMALHSPNLTQVPNVEAEFGKECRALFCAPPGYKLVGTDLSSIELRMLAHALAYWDDGKFARECEEGDPHAAAAEQCGISRSQGKRLNFALIFGAGDQKLGEIIGGDRKEGRTLRRRFYDSNPAFRKFLESIQEKATSEGKLIGLDGRPLYPRSAHSAANLWIQNAASTVAKKATLLHFLFLEANGVRHAIDFTLAVHAHDEWQVEIIEQEAETAAVLALEAISAAGQFYDLKVALSGETKVGQTWAETH